MLNATSHNEEDLTYGMHLCKAILEYFSPKEELWTIYKCDVYENRKQYDLSNDLWEAIRTAVNVEVKTIRKLSKSVNERLTNIIECLGTHMNMTNNNINYSGIAYINIYQHWLHHTG